MDRNKEAFILGLPLNSIIGRVWKFFLIGESMKKETIGSSVPSLFILLYLSSLHQHKLYTRGSEFG